MGKISAGEHWAVDPRFAFARDEIKIGAARRPRPLDDPFGDGLDGRMESHVALQ
jgi:hypothetical protein